MRRGFAVLLTALSLVSGARAEPSPASIVLAVDNDDDDADGVADLEQAVLAKPNLVDLQQLELDAKHSLRAASGGVFGLRVDGRELALPLKPLTKGRVGVQGLKPGRGTLELAEGAVNVTVLEARALDHRGASIDPARSHASLSRVLPQNLSGAQPDHDSLSWLVLGPIGAVPDRLSIHSLRPDGTRLDQLRGVQLKDTACPAGTPSELVCRRSVPIRATADDVDRNHPESAAFSLRAEVGGRLEVRAADLKLSSVRVGGPRESRLGAIGRLRGRLRVFVLKLSARGSVAVGGNPQGAKAVARAEVDTASALWGQCGVHFGLESELSIQVVDPPPPSLLAVGCDYGLPASGGTLRFRVGSRSLSVPTRAGETPTQVAARIRAALSKAGVPSSLSANAAIAPGALRSVDVVLAQPGRKSPALSADGAAPLSSDPTLNLCLGEVNLADGVTHFSDYDAPAGTLEERALIRAFDDGDPTTIEVFIVPSFARSGRIGESFIHSDGSSIENVVILDRAGVRAGARSYALAHELGHILLDMPGHPDDFGVDQPSSLMDADAADPSIFGPRRLSVEECERVLRQSGPKAPVPLLSDWPLYRQ